MELNVNRPKCPVHPEQDQTGQCGECSQGICRECVSEFGYFCSEACREESKQNISATERARTVDSMQQYETSMALFKLFGFVVLGLALLGIGYVVWLTKFDKRGRIVWQWKPGKAAGIVRVLGKSGNNVLLYAKGKLCTLRLKDGTVVDENVQPNLAGLYNVKILGDRLVGWSHNRVFCLDLKTGASANIPFDGGGSGQPVFDDAYANAWYMASTYDTKGMSYTLHHVNLHAGKETPPESLTSATAASLIGGHNGAPVLLMKLKSSRKRTRKAGWYLRLVRGGKSVMLPLVAQPNWGPVLEEGWMTMRIAKELHVINLGDGRSFTFSLPRDDYVSEPGYIIRDQQLLIALSGGTLCCELEKGKTVWQSTLSLSHEHFWATDEAFITLGSRSEDVKSDLSALSGGGQAPNDLLKDLGGAMGTGVSRKKYIPVLAALDRNTGKIIWNVEHVRGDMVADKKRIAFIMDTAVTGFNPLGSAESTLYVRQFDIDSGREIVTRQSENVKKIGHSTLVGRYAINVYSGGAMNFDFFNIKPTDDEQESAVIQAILLD